MSNQLLREAVEDLREAYKQDWKNKTVRSKKTGRTIKVGSLSPKEQEKYRPRASVHGDQKKQSRRADTAKKHKPSRTASADQKKQKSGKFIDKALSGTGSFVLSTAKKMAREWKIDDFYVKVLGISNKSMSISISAESRDYPDRYIKGPEIHQAAMNIGLTDVVSKEEDTWQPGEKKYTVTGKDKHGNEWEFQKVFGNFLDVTVVSPTASDTGPSYGGLDPAIVKAVTGKAWDAGLKTKKEPKKKITGHKKGSKFQFQQDDIKQGEDETEAQERQLMAHASEGGEFSVDDLSQAVDKHER